MVDFIPMPAQHLDPNEYEFQRLECAELAICRDYELGREIVRGDREQCDAGRPLLTSESLEARVELIRRNWSGKERLAVNQRAYWISYPTPFVLVTYPEWPQTPYLGIDPDERKRRAQRVEAEFHQTVDLSDSVTLEAMINNLEWAPWADELKGASKDPDALAIFEGVPLRLMLPKGLDNREWLVLIAAYLKRYFPHQERKPSRGGRGPVSPADDLPCIAVRRLTVVKRKRPEIIDLVRAAGKGPNAAARYNHIKKLSYPLERLKRRLARFRLEVLADLDPLEPVEGLGPGPKAPDWESMGL